MVLFQAGCTELISISRDEKEGSVMLQKKMSTSEWGKKGEENCHYLQVVYFSDAKQ